MKFTELTKEQLTETIRDYITENSMTIKSTVKEQMFSDTEELVFIYELENDVEKVSIIVESVLYDTSTKKEEHDSDRYLVVSYEYEDETLIVDLIMF